MITMNPIGTVAPRTSISISELTLLRVKLRHPVPLIFLIVEVDLRIRGRNYPPQVTAAGAAGMSKEGRDRKRERKKEGDSSRG